MQNYDLAVIGAGPGGYVSAIYASRLGMKTCLIEKDSVGGTCLNHGCIPTKVMLNCAAAIKSINAFRAYGVEVAGYNFAQEKLFSKREEVVTRLRSGIMSLLAANKVVLIKGAGRIKSQGLIDIAGALVGAKNIIIAAGSSPMDLPGMKFDDARILSSEGILRLKSIPKSIIIVGGGVIGCEFATFYNTVGSKVYIIELMDRLLPTMDRELGKRLEVILKKRGIDIHTSVRVGSMNNSGDMVLSELQDGHSIKSETALICVGRRPNTAGLGLEELGISLDKGRIVVNEFLETGVKGVFAIGDCINGPMLAHAASYEGTVVCDNIAGKKRRVDYNLIPSCIFTEPEIAACGLTEDEAKKLDPDSKAVKFPYMASSKAQVINSADGFIKMVGAKDGRLLGIEIMGHNACDLIGEASLAIAMKANIEDIANAVHAHPTLSEIFGDASHLFLGKPIHTI